MTNVHWFLVFAYFLPTFIAVVCLRRNAIAIFLVNLLLGWTILFWFVALAMNLRRADTNDAADDEEGSGDDPTGMESDRTVKAHRSPGLAIRDLVSIAIDWRKLL